MLGDYAFFVYHRIEPVGMTHHACMRSDCINACERLFGFFASSFG
jgi:hypothetical protein